MTDEDYVARRLALLEGDAGVLPDGQTVAEAREALERASLNERRIRRAAAFERAIDGYRHEPNQWNRTRAFPNMRKQTGCCGQ